MRTETRLLRCDVCPRTFTGNVQVDEENGDSVVDAGSCPTCGNVAYIQEPGKVPRPSLVEQEKNLRADEIAAAARIDRMAFLRHRINQDTMELDDLEADRRSSDQVAASEAAFVAAKLPEVDRRSPPVDVGV